MSALENGLCVALTRQAERHHQWTKIAPCIAPIGGLACAQIQHAGRLDCILIQMEAEQEAQRSDAITAVQIFMPALSEAFIFSLFEPVNRAVKSLHKCSLRSCSGVLYDLYLVRTLLSKGQLPQYEEKKHGRIHLAYHDGTPAGAYDSIEDGKAAFIAPYIQSTATGSLGWIVPDLKNGCSKQIFRRDLSDQVLALKRLSDCLPSFIASPQVGR